MAEVTIKTRTEMGKVISDQMDKTVVVLVERLVRHPKYGKYIKRSTKLHAHDDGNISKIGDIVLIRASRPRSKMKTWELVEVVTKSPE
jgi:small subunit ribosomal protein S17